LGQTGWHAISDEIHLHVDHDERRLPRLQRVIDMESAVAALLRLVYEPGIDVQRVHDGLCVLESLLARRREYRSVSLERTMWGFLVNFSSAPLVPNVPAHLPPPNRVLSTQADPQAGGGQGGAIR